MARHSHALVAGLLVVSSLQFSAAQAPPSCQPVLPAVGCFDDSKGPHAVNVTLVDASSSLTVPMCVAICTSVGYPLVGLTSHTTPSPQATCYCGLSIDPGAVPAPGPQCNLPCPGGGGGNCGANYRLEVYNTTCSGPLPPPPPPQPALTGPACSQPESVGWGFCNKSLTIDERVQDLVSRLYIFELGPQLTARSAPPIPRLGIGVGYYMGLNFVHGITNPVTNGILCTASGKCPTIFPAGAALGASFNASAWHAMGDIGGTEMRALNNVNWRDVAGEERKWGDGGRTPGEGGIIYSRKEAHQHSVMTPG